MQQNHYKHGEVKSNSYGGRSVWHDDNHDYYAMNVPSFQLFSVAEAEKNMKQQQQQQQQHAFGHKHHPQQKFGLEASQNPIGVNQLSPVYDAVVPKAIDQRRYVSQEPIGYNPNRPAVVAPQLSSSFDYAKSGLSPNTFALFNYNSQKSAEFIRSFSPLSPQISPAVPMQPQQQQPQQELAPPLEIKKRNSSNFDPIQDQDEDDDKDSYHEDFISFMGGMEGVNEKLKNPHNSAHQQQPSSPYDPQQDDYGGYEDYHLSSSAPAGSDMAINNSLDEGDGSVVVVASSGSPPHVEHPLGEHPSRTLFVRNISSNVEDEQLRDLFEAHGAIRSMYTQCKHRGFVMISYYDIRHAKAAMKNLQHKIINRRKIDIHYSIPKENPSEKDLNQGTLVVFNLDPSITNEELKKVFGKHGEIKEIRETPNKKHHKFIEFYDVRDAERAMKALNKSDLRGKKIKIEPSRPGGARRNLMYSSIWAMEMAGNGGNSSTSTEPMQGSSPIDMMVSMNPQQQQQPQQQPLQQSPMVAAPIVTMSQSPLASAIVAQGKHVQQQVPLQQQQAVSSSPMQQGMANFAQYQPFQPPSYSQVSSSPVVFSSQVSLSSSMPSPSRFSALFNSHKQQQQQQQAVNGMNNAPLVGSSSIFSVMPEHATLNPVVHSPIMQPPPQQQAQVITPPSPAQQAIVQAAVAVAQASAPPASSPKQVIAEPQQKEAVRKNSRAGRNNNNDVKKQFQLDIDKVRNSIDVRTTLMIKNIPNKYTQKMLLQTIDLKFKSTYDFFYLPIDFKNKCNVGYAFINFINPISIIAFHDEFNSKKWEKFNSEKVCDITYARIQGKNALINHFQNSSLMVEDPACRPIFIL